MRWTLIPNSYSHITDRDNWGRRKTQGLFLRRCKTNSNQIYASKELVVELGDHVKVYQDGHRFLLRPARKGEKGARSISGANSSIQRKFSCKPLYQALDDGRVYVKKVEGGFEL